MSYTYINEHEIDLELKCILCNQPFLSPIDCQQCGQTFCQQCITSWVKQQQLSCPFCEQTGTTFTPVVTRVVLNQLNRLLVQCSLCQQTNIERGNFSDHTACACPKQMMTCKNNCKWRGHREDLEEHLMACRRKRRRWHRLLRYFARGEVLKSDVFD